MPDMKGLEDVQNMRMQFGKENKAQSKGQKTQSQSEEKINSERLIPICPGRA
ncbi:MAG: hypothetical protein ACYSUX_12020 [Planctomycetota bacterium]|jgi:hypothetical protein